MSDKKNTPPQRPQERERERKDIGNYNDGGRAEEISFDRPIPPPKDKK